jgi:hypothetical protein
MDIILIEFIRKILRCIYMCTKKNWAPLEKTTLNMAQLIWLVYLELSIASLFPTAHHLAALFRNIAAVASIAG